MQRLKKFYNFLNIHQKFSKKNKIKMNQYLLKYKTKM